MYDLPAYIWPEVFVAAIGMPAATSVVLYRGATRAGLGRRRAAGVGAAAATLLAGSSPPACSPWPAPIRGSGNIGTGFGGRLRAAVMPGGLV
jgi:hypothetical protein